MAIPQHLPDCLHHDLRLPGAGERGAKLHTRITGKLTESAG
jgi:hypothetical protein